MALERDRSGILRMGGVILEDVVATAGTPTYVYDLDGIAAEARAVRGAFDGARHLVAYAVKANTAGAVVRTLAREGCGADVVSGAELRVALGCGIAPDHIVYSGVAKQDREIDWAIRCGPKGIGAVQIESVEEVVRIEARAREASKRARVSLRLNPGVDLAHATHAHIATGHDAAKFGIRTEEMVTAIRLVEASPHLELVGLATHVGSQLTTLGPYVDGARVLFDFVKCLRDDGKVRSLAFLDSGGGMGIDYDSEPQGSTRCPRPAEFVRAARSAQRARGLDDLALYLEPGRALVGPHGVLLASIVQPKVTAGARWLMIDAGMNDLIRPALYQARHRIAALRVAPDERPVSWRVAGPVCESSDDFGEHVLPAELSGAVAILDCGAYGYSMASEYNGRQVPVEVFVSGGRIAGMTQRGDVARWVEKRLAAGSTLERLALAHVPE